MLPIKAKLFSHCDHCKFLIFSAVDERLVNFQRLPRVFDWYEELIRLWFSHFWDTSRLLPNSCHKIAYFSVSQHINLYSEHSIMTDGLGLYILTWNLTNFCNESITGVLFQPRKRANIFIELGNWNKKSDGK